jgi:WD40 repeat protein
MTWLALAAANQSTLGGLVAAIVLLAALVPFVFWLIDALRGKDVDLAAKEDEARKERERAALFEAQRKKAEEDRAKLEGATEAERLQRRRGIAVQKAKAATSWVAAPQQAAQLLADEAVWPAPLRDDSWKAFELASRFDRNQVAPLGGQILQVVYSPDGKYYAAAVNHQYWLPPRDRGGLVAVPRVELRLMELTTGKLIAVLPIADHSGLRAAFSPDSKFVAIGGGNANAMGSVLIVETATGKSREQSFGPGSYLRGALHLSAEGRKLTFVDPSGIQTIDLKTGAREPTFNPWLGLVDTGAFSPDGQRFAPLPIIRVPLPNDPVVPVRVLERNRKDPREYRGPAHGPVALAFSADGKQIAAVCHQASVRFNEPSPPAELWVWDVESGKGEKVASWQVGVGPLQTQIAFLPEGTRIAAYVATGKSVRVSVHDVSKKTEVAGWQVPLDGTEVPFATVSYLPGEFTNAGCSFILSDRLGNVRRFDTLSGKLLASSSPAGHSEGPACYAFSSRAGLLATGSNDQEYPTYTIRLWQAATGKELHRLDCGPIPVAGLAFSADGTKLASVGHGRSGAEACLWDVVTGKQLWRKELTAWGTPRAVCFKPDGQQVAVAGGRDPGGFPTIGVPEQTGGSVLLLACTDGKQEGERKGHKAAIDSVAYSPDGTMLYTGAGIPKGNLGLGPKLEFAGGEVIEWKLSDDKWRRTHDNLPRVPLTLAVTDDGRTLIAAYVKVLGVVEFWETVVKD